MMDAPVTLRLPAVGLSEKHAKPSSTIELSVATNDPPDEALMAQICQESREALAILFRRYSRVVRGVAYCILRDASEADDLLPDIFILIHRRCRTFDSSKGSAQFWILQMADRPCHFAPALPEFAAFLYAGGTRRPRNPRFGAPIWWG